MNLGDTFPNFRANTTIGEIEFYNWLGDSWGALFSHPADYTPVCTTELARVAQLHTEFLKRNVKPIALSCDNVESHIVGKPKIDVTEVVWTFGLPAFRNMFIPKLNEELEMTGREFPYPIIDDENRSLAILLNMLDKDEIGAHGMPLTCRAVFIIDTKRKLRLSILYPASTGRNFDEILRVIDALQLTDNNEVSTPVDWKRGEACMVLPTVKDDDIPIRFPNGVTKFEVPSGKSYIRKTPCPK